MPLGQSHPCPFRLPPTHTPVALQAPLGQSFDGMHAIPARVPPAHLCSLLWGGYLLSWTVLPTVYLIQSLMLCPLPPASPESIPWQLVQDFFL